VVENGPDPEETPAVSRTCAPLYQQTLASMDELGLQHLQTQALAQQLGDRFLQFQLVPKTLIS